MPENINYSGALYSLNKSLGKNSWNFYNTNNKNSSNTLSPKSTSKPAYHSRDSGGVFYFINLQDLQGDHNSEFKVLRLQRKQPKSQPSQSQKDYGVSNKMVFDVFNRNLYNAASLTNKNKCSVTKTKSKTKKKSAAKKSGQLILSYYQQANKARFVDENAVSLETNRQQQEPAKKHEQKLKSSSLTSDYYNSSQLTMVRKDCGFQPKLCEASSSRIFRMDSFLNSFVPTKKEESSQETKKKKNLAGDEFMNAKQQKKNNFFPNQTLMATCNKIFDICKLTDSGNTGSFFNFTKNNRTELRLFNKAKIRKKIRDNVFSFKRQKKLSPQALPASNTGKLSIMVPCESEKKTDSTGLDSKSADEVKSINTQSSVYTGVTQSSAYTELQQLSSNSEIYFNQKITAVESTNASFSQLNDKKGNDAKDASAHDMDSDDNEIAEINKSQEVLDLDVTIGSPEEAKETPYQHFKRQQNNDVDPKMSEDDEEGVLYSYNHYHVPERKNMENVPSTCKKKLTCEIERTRSDLSDSPKIQYLNIIVHRLPGN